MLLTAIKKTQKKTSALGKITIPNLEARITYIEQQLEERERDEWVRLQGAFSVAHV